jgi:hypothetical protein
MHRVVVLSRSAPVFGLRFQKGITMATRGKVADATSGEIFA